MPPASSAVRVNGGNPSVNEAAPAVMPIWDATGTGNVFVLSPAANPSDISVVGREMVISGILAYGTVIVNETPGGTGTAPDCCKIANSMGVRAKSK